MFNFQFYVCAKQSWKVTTVLALSHPFVCMEQDDFHLADVSEISYMEFSLKFVDKNVLH